MRSSITRVAAVAVPLASLISLTACRGVVVAASPGTGGHGYRARDKQHRRFHGYLGARDGRHELRRGGHPGARLGRHLDDKPPVEDLDGQCGCHLRADRRALPGQRRRQ